MSINAILTDFRAQFPACYALAFADISTSMVLATSASKPLDQEFWDGIAESARLHLNTETSDEIAKCLNPGKADKLGVSLISDTVNLQVFMRSGLDPEFAICSMVDKNIDLKSFFAASKLLADQLTQNA